MMPCIQTATSSTRRKRSEKSLNGGKKERCASRKGWTQLIRRMHPRGCEQQGQAAQQQPHRWLAAAVSMEMPQPKWIPPCLCNIGLNLGCRGRLQCPHSSAPGSRGPHLALKATAWPSRLWTVSLTPCGLKGRGHSMRLPSSTRGLIRPSHFILMSWRLRQGHLLAPIMSRGVLREWKSWQLAT